MLFLYPFYDNYYCIILMIERTLPMRIKLINGASLPKHGRKGDAGYDFFLKEDIKIFDENLDATVLGEIAQEFENIDADVFMPSLWVKK